MTGASLEGATFHMKGRESKGKGGILGDETRFPLLRKECSRRTKHKDFKVKFRGPADMTRRKRKMTADSTGPEFAAITHDIRPELGHATKGRKGERKRGGKFVLTMEGGIQIRGPGTGGSAPAKS